MLARNCHHCRHLQNAWNKYSSRQFAFKILERCPSALLLVREQYWINQTPKSHLFNTCLTAGSALGVKRTITTRQRLSATQKEVSARPEIKSQRIAAVKLAWAEGRITPHKLTAAAKIKIGEAQRKLCQEPAEIAYRSNRAKQMHADGRIPPRPVQPIKPRTCRKCHQEFIPVRLPSGLPSGTKWCDQCRPPHLGGRYKTASKLIAGVTQHYRKLGPPCGWKHTEEAKKKIAAASKAMWVRKVS
jgi:hypothetical protein